MVKKMTIWSYLEPFLYTKEYLHLADVSKRLKKPHSSVRKYLNYFEKLGILIKTNKGRLTLYRLNLDSPTLVDYLVLAEKEKLTNKRRKDIILNELISFLQSHSNENNKIVIFGSAVTDRKKSNDIDLLISGKMNFEEEIKKFKKKFNVKIHFINVKNLKTVNQTLKNEIMEKHLIVQGSEGIVKWLI